MLSVENRTSYATERTAVIDKTGAVVWVVVVKATYDIAPDGTVSLAGEQIPPKMAPEYSGEDGQSSLAYETDLVVPKKATDILINGFAHAPGGRPSEEFNAGFELAGLRKMVTVRGDRRYDMSMAGVVRAGKMTPVVRVPLRYERAYGGYDDKDPNPAKQRMDPRNPVGTGVAVRPANLVGLPVANFEYPGKDPAVTGPAGFGPIACHWEPRIGYAGIYDAAWVSQRKPLLPEDFDERYHQCAPTDQQLPGLLPKDARITLINLSARGNISVLLPRVFLRFTTFFTEAARQRRVDHRGVLNTILVDPEENCLIMVWSSKLECGRDVDHINATRVTEKEHI